MNSIIKKAVYICFTLLCILGFSTIAYGATQGSSLVARGGTAGSSTIVYGTTQGVVTGNRVNVRSYAEINDNNRLFQLDRGHVVQVLGTDGDFFRINVDENENVYIARDFVRITEIYGVMNFHITNVYDLPSQKGGHPIGIIEDGMSVVITSVFENWFGISYRGELAFVERSFLRVPYFVDLPTTRLPGSKTLGEEIVEFAKQYLGTQYIFGGTTPSGFDCSGFMLYVLSNFNISVNRVSRDQARNGVEVNRNELEPGDLVFFAASSGGSRITHVGMYIGGESFIHSSTWNVGVIISDISNGSRNCRRFVTARRVI